MPGIPHEQIECLNDIALTAGAIEPQGLAHKLFVAHGVEVAARSAAPWVKTDIE
jgi:hypothetical protein